MYSKYHGALFLIFIIASDWKLLLQSKFYLVGVLAILLFSPHIYWQYVNEFPSFQYHLSDRVNRQEWWFVPEYIGNQLLIYNPIMWFIFLPIFIKNTKKTLFTKRTSFQKTNYYILYGFLAFFFFLAIITMVLCSWPYAWHNEICCLGERKSQLEHLSGDDTPIKPYRESTQQTWNGNP